MSITGVCFPISVGDKDIVKSCSSSLTPALARAVVTCVYLYFYLQNGELDLTFHIYRLSFLNFLLGKQANGPGQYLFGTVTPETPTCMFPIGKIHGPLQKWTDYSKLTMTKLGSRIS